VKQRVLVSSILMGLAAGFACAHAFAQTTDASAADGAKKKETTELGGVVVTGSLIPQAQIETASPTIQISSVQMQKLGFANVYEALRKMPLANGAVQDSQSTANFTPGAQEISLFGLDPGFTLIMINGHPMADFPLMFNGMSNIVDLTNIPTGMVDRIDILPGNNSSIYGSSAIAGVVNIILKDRVEGFELNLRTGGYKGGGGENQRLQFLGGHSWGQLDLTFGAELNNQQPIWGRQRALTRSTDANPDPSGRYGVPTFAVDNYGPDLSDELKNYLDPGDACGSLKGLFNGTTTRDYRPNHGYFCGSKYANGYNTINNKHRSAIAYANLKYKLDEETQIYGNLVYSLSKVTFSSNSASWSSNGGQPLYDQNTDNFEMFERVFSPEETGGQWPMLESQISRTYTAWAGIKGVLGKGFDYDLYYSRSQNNVADKSPWPLTKPINEFFEKQFLGPKLGTTSGYPVYAPNIANLYKPLTPAQYASFNGVIHSKNSAWTQNLNLQITNTELFNLPAGAVGFAGVAQIGSQAWSNPNDPRVINGEFLQLAGTSGGGTRNNWAFAGELRVPLTSMLTANLSARYDQYSEHRGGTDAHPTYKLGLEFRPNDAWLLRANYGNAFRAPDMSYVFGGKSSAYQTFNDSYLCQTRYPGTPIDQCPYARESIQTVHYGNQNLKSITAKSWGYGLVFSPTPDFDVKLDYININISNEVLLQSVNGTLQLEAACRTGQIDIKSPTCVATLAQIVRNPADSANPNALQSVTVLPINVAKENTSAIVASLDYKLDIGRYGSLTFAGQYNVTLKHMMQQYPGEPAIDMLRSPYYAYTELSGPQFKTILNGSVTWDVGAWSATLFGIRYGKTPNYIAQSNTTGFATPGAGTVAPWITYNGSINYNVNDAMRLSFIVNNIKDSMPPKDRTWNVAPFYNIGSYNPFGRQVWLEFDWKFGRAGK